MIWSTEIEYNKTTLKLGKLNNLKLDQQAEPKWVELSRVRVKPVGSAYVYAQ